MKIATRLVGVILGTTLFSTSLPVFADAMVSAPQHADWLAFQNKRITTHLTRLADMLQLNDTQRQSAAWADYGKAYRDLHTQAKWKHNENADAATLSSDRAEAAKLYASKLQAVAVATHVLQATLSQPQRKVFNDLVRHDPPFHHGLHPFHRGPLASSTAE